MCNLQMHLERRQIIVLKICSFYLPYIYICVCVLISDVIGHSSIRFEVLTDLVPQRQKRAIQDLDFFSWSLNNPWWSISIQTISFSSRINQNTSAWFSDGISVPREIKGYNMLSSRFQQHQPAWTNTAAFLQMCWKSTFETACNSATRWLIAMCINFNMAKSEINT